MWDSHDILGAEYCMWNMNEWLESKDVFPYMFILVITKHILSDWLIFKDI